MSPIVDLSWGIVTPATIPVHHQYPLLSAISRLIPDVHHSGAYGIHPIRGNRFKPGYLELNSASTLSIRTSTDNIRLLLSLSGKQLNLAGCSIRLGVPHIVALEPAPNLMCYLTTIKGYQEADHFPVGLRKQLDNAGVSASVNVVLGSRRVLRIKQQMIVGFEVELNGLTNDESLRIQVQGLGGRRHLGCGLFNPISRAIAS